MRKVVAVPSPIEPWLKKTFETTVDVSRVTEFLESFFAFNPSLQCLAHQLAGAKQSYVIGSSVPILLGAGDCSGDKSHDLDLRVFDKGGYNQLLTIFSGFSARFDVRIDADRSFTVTMSAGGVSKTVDISCALEQNPEKSCLHLGDSLMVSINTGTVLSCFPGNMSDLDYPAELFSRPFQPNTQLADTQKWRVFAKYIRESKRNPNCIIPQDSFVTVFGNDLDVLVKETHLIGYLQKSFRNDKERHTFLVEMDITLQQNVPGYRDPDYGALSSRLRTLIAHYETLAAVLEVKLKGADLKLKLEASEKREVVFAAESGNALRRLSEVEKLLSRFKGKVGKLEKEKEALALSNEQKDRVLIAGQRDVAELKMQTSELKDAKRENRDLRFERDQLQKALDAAQVADIDALKAENHLLGRKLGREAHLLTEEKVRTKKLRERLAKSGEKEKGNLVRELDAEKREVGRLGKQVEELKKRLAHKTRLKKSREEVSPLVNVDGGEKKCGVKDVVVFDETMLRYSFQQILILISLFLLSRGLGIVFWGATSDQ